MEINKTFNKLNPAELERLAFLLEELGEAQQAIGKILRHGYKSKHPDRFLNNKEDLCCELGDVLAAIEILKFSKDLSQDKINFAKQLKLKKVNQYMHHQS